MRADRQYRESAYPWLGGYPADWRLVPFKYVFEESTEINGDSVVGPMLAVSGYRGVEVKRYEHEEQRRSAEMLGTYRVVREGQLAVNTMWLNYSGLGVSDIEGHMSPAYRAYWIKPGVDRRYAHHLMRCSRYVDGYTAHLHGIRPNSLQMDRDTLGRWPVLIPPLPEQQAIADYLDRETARIDTLITKQESLITLLRERRIATQDAAIGSGIAAGTRIRYLFRQSTAANSPEEQVLSVYRDYGVIPKASRSDNANQTPLDLRRYLVVRPGDLVINKMKAWQGSLGISAEAGIVSGDYEVARPITPSLDPKFAHYSLRAARRVAEYRARSRGVRPSQWRLYWGDFSDVRISVPPLVEQREIVAYLDEQTAKIDALIAKAQRFIELAKERRAALITAAVTGQIDVRDVA